MKTDFNESYISPHVHPAYWRQPEASNDADMDAYADAGAVDRQQIISGFVKWLAGDGKSPLLIGHYVLILAWMIEPQAQRCSQRDLARRMSIDAGNLNRKIKAVTDFLKQRSDADNDQLNQGDWKN